MQESEAGYADLPIKISGLIDMKKAANAEHPNNQEDANKTADDMLKKAEQNAEESGAGSITREGAKKAAEPAYVPCLHCYSYPI